MEGLRVPLDGEFDDLFPGDRIFARFDLLADFIIFKMLEVCIIHVAGSLPRRPAVPEVRVSKVEREPRS
jgi:hypothetical protein